jgi:erythromycin esterase
MNQFTRRETLGMAAGALLFARPAGAQGMAAAANAFDAEALAWLKRKAQPLDGHEPAPSSLRPLAEALAGAQVIGLGEATQGAHEEQALKAAIIRALVVHGELRVLALECNRRPAGLLDRYVQGGGPDPVATLRTSGLPPASLSEDLLGLVTWIRAWNLSGRPAVRIIGIDAQALAGDAWDAFRFLDESAPRLAEPLRKPLLPLIGNERLRDGRTEDLLRTLSPGQIVEIRAALDRLRAAIITVNRAGGEEAAQAALNARQAIDSAGRLGGAGPAANGQASAAAQLRDRQLAENLLTLSGGARTAYWSHNANVVGQGTATGAQLKRRLSRAYRSVVFEFERGTVQAQAGRTGAPLHVADRQPVPGGLGAFLSSVGPERFWADLSAADAPPAAWLSHPYAHDRRGAEAAGTASAGRGLALGGNVDLLVFQRRLTPARLLPFVA